MDSIELKQQYLRENILDANYDANQFMEYCESEYGGVSLDDWSLGQLEKIVNNFIKFKNSPITEFQNQNDFNSGFQDPNYHHKYQGFQIDHHKNKTVDPQISKQFNDWDNFIEPKKKQQTNQINQFQLNLLDLDFLESMGQSTIPKSSDHPKTQKQDRKKMIVPSQVVNKLKQGNSNFIVGYNPIQLGKGSPDKQKVTSQIQPQVKPVQIGAISGNISNPKSAVSSISPASNKQIPLSTGKTLKEEFQTKIQTKKVLNKSRLKGNEEATISNHEIINPNFIVPKYVVYWVSINPLNVEVKRRFKDFENLRQLLKKFFPTTQIPNLEKCSRLNETEPAIIEKQILFLESFMNGLLMNKELNCKLVEQFFLCPDLDLLKKFFKQYEKLARPRAIQGLFTTAGQTPIQISSKNQSFLNDQNSLITYMEDYFTKTKNLYDQLLESFHETSKKLHEIEEMHSGFFNKIKALNTRFTPDLQCPGLEKVLDRITYLHKQWSQSFKTQAKIIKSEIRHTYRFQSDNVSTLEQILKVETMMRQAYQKRGDKDQASREQYKSKKLEQYKLNVEVPSKNITVLKYQLGYHQQNCVQQSLRYLDQLCKKLDKKFQLFCQLEMSIGHDMEGCWREFDNFYK